MEAASTGRRGRPPDPRRRAAVLDAARAVFHEKGFAAASVREIADRAGLLSGSLYHHVASKEQLLFEIVRDVYLRSVAAAEEALAADGGSVERLELLMRAHVANVAQDVVTTGLALEEYRSLSPEHAGWVDERHRIYLGAFAALLARGQEEGAIDRGLDVELTTAAIVGCLNSVCRWWRPGGPVEAGALADGYVQVLLSGVVAA